MWTSHEELAWLTDCIPEFRRVQASPNEQILTWLRGLAPRFLAAFPEHSMRDPNDLVKRLRCWYSYHPDQIERAKSGESSVEPLAALPLSITHKQKKPSALVPWQAYSQLYFTKGSALHREVHADYADFKAGKSVTRSKYEHLFPNLEEDSLSTINWLPFYQAVMTERVKNASEVELTAVAEYIENRHQKELNIHERPWDAYGGGEDDSEESKKKRYLEMQIKTLPDSLANVYREVEDATNFRVFSLIGGLAPEGGGVLSVMRLQTGLTLNNKANGGFEAFLGDLYPVLKEKWCKWLATTYSEQVDPTKSVGISLQSSASNETPILDDPSSPGSSSSSAPAPPPPAAVNFVGPYRRPPRNHAYVFVPPRPTKRPLPDATSSEELSSDDEYDGRIPSNPDTDGESSHKINDNLFSTHEIDDESSSALEVDNESPTNEIENESSTSEIDNEPSFIRGINDDLFSTDEIDNDPSSVHEVDGESSTRGIDDNLFSVREIDNESSPLEVDGDESSTHEIDGDESSTHETDDEHEAPDVWALDERHPDFLHRAEQFLLTAPGGDNWRTMLLRYVQFEGLAAQTGGRLATTSRPEQVGWWSRIGRREFGKVPPIASLPDYEASWIAWWTALQPDWRDVRDWPFPRDAPVGHSWNKILVGGKDGLFIVVMTLCWWSVEHAKTEGESSELEVAIKDVSWVLSNLISTLAADDSRPRPLSRLPPPPANKGKRQRDFSVKVGPPRKRPRRGRS